MSTTDKTHQQIGDSNQSPELKKSRDALAKVNVAARTKHPEKEPVMNNVTNFPQPPVGFKIEYFCSCGMGCTPNDLNDEENCQILGSSYEGPGVHLSNSTGCQINSRWTAEEGIYFDVSNYGYTSDADDATYTEKPWNREQLEHLPKMVEQVLRKIDYAAAHDFFEKHPEHFENAATVQGLARLADENNLSVPEAFQAYMDIYKKRGGDNA